MLRYCYKVWWERIGNTKTSGITKLMLSEAHHFPEITEFYQCEVMRPGQMLIRRIPSGAWTATSFARSTWTTRCIWYWPR